MSNRKRMVVGSIILFMAFQAFQLARNKSGQVLPTDITKVVSAPPTIWNLLKNSCYDCHSNNTVYPWYARIQPGAWFMNRHILEGKKELNFSDFGSYSKRKQTSKMKAIANMVNEGDMPLKSYTMLHKTAKLTNEQKERLVSWSRSIADTIEHQ